MEDGCSVCCSPDSGVPFHVNVAKQTRAPQDEVVSALLVTLPAAGNGIMQSLPAAIEAYEAD